MFIPTIITLFAAVVSAAPAAHHRPSPEDLVQNYIKLWNGDYSLLQSTFHPKVTLHMDYLLFNGKPAPPVTDLYGFNQTIGFSRQGWESYTFEIENSVHDDKRAAIRWNMHGVVGEHFGRPTTLKPGDKFEYSGTDFLQFDGCSGLIKTVQIAQDSLDFYHKLGVKEVQVQSS